MDLTPIRINEIDPYTNTTDVRRDGNFPLEIQIHETILTPIPHSQDDRKPIPSHKIKKKRHGI